MPGEGRVNGVDVVGMADEVITVTISADQGSDADAVMADWLVRSYLPAVLDHTPVASQGEQVRALAPITVEIVHRPGQLRAYVTPTRAAASAIERIEFEGYDQSNE